MAPTTTTSTAARTPTTTCAGGPTASASGRTTGTTCSSTSTTTAAGTPCTTPGRCAGSSAPEASEDRLAPRHAQHRARDVGRGRRRGEEDERGGDIGALTGTAQGRVGPE